MYIEFNLPTGAMITGIARDELRKELVKWAKEQSLDIVRQEYITGHYRVWLSAPKAYTQFALTWQPNRTYFDAYRVINAAE